MFSRHSVAPVGLIFLSSTRLVTALPAWADLFKCPDGQGGIVFKSEPCEATWAPPQVAPAAAPLAAAEARPLGQATLQSNPALADAFKALRKIHAATQVGITRSEYGKLVVDAQAVLNDVSPATAQSDVRLVHSELATAMQAYVDAGTWWQFADNLKPMDHGVFLRLVRTYTLPVSQVGGGNLTPAKDEALARIWQDAAWHLDRAAQAAGGAHDDVGRIESADGSSGRT